MSHSVRSDSSTELIGVRMPFSTVPDDDAHGTGALANPTDSATIELALLSVGELRAGPVLVSGISTSPTGAFPRRNKLRRSRSSRSCNCPWKSGIKSGLSRCRALRLGQMSFKFSDSLDERRCLVPFLQLCELFLRIDNLFLEYVSLLSFFSGSTISRVLCFLLELEGLFAHHQLRSLFLQ